MGFAALVVEREPIGVYPFFLILVGILCFLFLVALTIVGVVLFLARNRNRDRPADTR